MTAELVTGELLEFDQEKREIYGRIVPWGVDAPNHDGLHLFEAGAFDGIEPGAVISRARHQDPGTGVAIALENKPDGAYARFRIARTVAGDEQLTLARDGVEKGLSIGIDLNHPDAQFTTERVGNKTRFRHKRAVLNEVSTTWKPAFRDAVVLQVHERENMPEPQENVPVPQVPVEFAEKIATLQAAIERVDERTREFAMQAIVPQVPQASTFERMVRLDDTFPVADKVREFALANVTTTGNEGVVPDVLSTRMLGRIEQGRPFLNATTQIPAPAAGLSLLMPKITQRPLVATQAAEKDELASRATTIGTVDFNMVTKGGAGDLSMQLIRRSSPEFLALWLELLGQAYAQNTEDGAIDALIAATVSAGGVFDPEAPAFGTAFTNAVTATTRTMTPDRIFLSTAGLVALMNAREAAGGGGAALYPGLAGIGGGIGGIGAGGGAGLGFQLTPVWVPELDDEAPDIIIGPSQAFVWAEDGTYTLQADVPAKFGRDVGLAGMIWYAPIYPLAFTSFTLS